MDADEADKSNDTLGPVLTDLGRAFGDGAFAISATAPASCGVTSGIPPVVASAAEAGTQVSLFRISGRISGFAGVVSIVSTTGRDSEEVAPEGMGALRAGCCLCWSDRNCLGQISSVGSHLG